MRIHSALAPVAALAFALSPSLAAASDPPGKISVQVQDEDGSSLDLEINSSWIAAFASLIDIECESSADRDTRRMVRFLDRAGEGGRYRFIDDDGDDVLAIRRNGLLRIEVNDDGDDAVVEIPWAVAECFLLGREPEGGVAGLFSGDKFQLKVDARDRDSRVRVRID